MGYLVSEFLLEGFVKNYTVMDLINGFDTPIVSKINKGSMLKGNLYISGTVTPLLNSMTGPYSNVDWKVGTGNNTSNSTTAPKQGQVQ